MCSGFKGQSVGVWVVFHSNVLNHFRKHSHIKCLAQNANRLNLPHFVEVLLFHQILNLFMVGSTCIIC